MSKWNSNSSAAEAAAFSTNRVVSKRVIIYRIRIVIIVLVVLAILGFASVPAYRWFRERQLDRNLEAARVALRVKDWVLARDKARSVLIGRPTDFEAYRLWFKALSKMGEPRAYMAAMGLFVDPRASAEDRMDSLRVLCERGPHALAIAAFASLSKEVKAETATRIAFAPLLLQRGEIARSEKMLREAPGLESNPAARFELLRILCASPTPERVTEARAIFSGLIQDDASSELALDALLVLGEVHGGLDSGPPFTKLTIWVEKQTKATTLHHLLALNPDIQAAGTGADLIFQQAIQRFLDLDPGIVGTWLIRHGRSTEAARLLEPFTPNSSAAYFSRISALRKEDDLDGIDKLLANPPKSVDLVDLELARAFTARARGDSAGEKNAFNKALDNAAYDQSRNRYLEIAKIAKAYGLDSVVNDAWVAAVRLGWGTIPLARDLLGVMRSLQLQNRNEDLLAMFRILGRFEPGNAELLNNFNYLALLLDVIPPREAINAFESLVASYPKVLNFHSGLAMAHLMSGNSTEALQQTRLMEKSQSVSLGLRKAIEGTALCLAGDAAKGRPMLEAIKWDSLMRCESAVFNRILAKLEVKELVLPDPSPVRPEIDPETVPAWRKAIERMEKQQAQDELPSLPMPKIPGADRESSEF